MKVDACAAPAELQRECGGQDVRRTSGEIGVNDLDQLLCGERARVVAWQRRVDQVLANVVLDNFGDETLECSPAGSGLLQDSGTLLFSFDGALDSLDLAPDPFESIQQLCALSLDMSHF